MCLTCGCDEPNNGHGNNANITLDRLEEAAKAAGISGDEAVKNIQRAYSQRNKKAA